MKKIIVFIFVLILLWSCSEDKNISDKIIEKNEICENEFEIWKINKLDLNLKWVIVNDDLKTIWSPTPWIVNFLNCENWKIIKKDDLVATILPDFNNPNTINLSIQKSSLENQKINLASIKSTTIMSFDNQISDIKDQINITENNIELTKKSSNLNKLDLENQIDSLNNTLLSLEKNLELLNLSKKESIEKINISKESLYVNMSSISSDNLLKIDEIFWITDENNDLNDSYEDYLSVKNIWLLSIIKNSYLKLIILNKNLDKMSENDISVYLWDLVELNITSRNAIKASVANIKFSQTQIDWYYNLFLNYWNNLAEIKSWWDSLDNSKSSINASFDSQISTIENQINSTKSSLDNLKTNKTDSIDVWLDLQIAWLNSWLKSLNSSLTNLISNKWTQVLSLDNQLLQISQSIDSLNVNLSKRNIYAWIDWIINQKFISEWNNVGINTPLCQILPNTDSTKIKVYSSVLLSLGDIFEFKFENKDYKISIENELQTKDKITQNYVYESNYLDDKKFKWWEILNLKFISNSNNENTIVPDNNSTWIKEIPVSYIKNKINWNFIKTISWSTLIDLKVKVWDINGNKIEILEWLDSIIKICK